MNKEDDRHHGLKILSFCCGPFVPLMHYYLGKFLSPSVQSLKKKHLANYMIISSLSCDFGMDQRSKCYTICIHRRLEGSHILFGIQGGIDCRHYRRGTPTAIVGHSGASSHRCLPIHSSGRRVFCQTSDVYRSETMVTTTASRSGTFRT